MITFYPIQRDAAFFDFTVKLMRACKDVNHWLFAVIDVCEIIMTWGSKKGVFDSETVREVGREQIGATCVPAIRSMWAEH